MIVQPGVVIKTLMLHTKLASCRSLSSSIRVFFCAHILCHIQVGQHSSRDAESKTVLAVDSGAEIINYMLGHHETTYQHAIRQHDAVHFLFLGAGLFERCCLFSQKRADTTNDTHANIKPGLVKS